MAVFSTKSKKIFASAATAAAALVLYTNLTVPNHKHNHQGVSVPIRSGVFEIKQSHEKVEVGATHVMYRVDDTSLNPVEINKMIRQASLQGVAQTIRSYDNITNIQNNPQSFADNVRAAIQKEIDSNFFNSLQVRKGVAPLVLEEITFPSICLKSEMYEQCVTSVSSASQSVKSTVLQLRSRSEPLKSSMESFKK